MDNRDQWERKRKCFTALAVACLLPLWSLHAFSQSGGSADSRPSDKGAALEQAIHDYILAHPEVLIQSLQQAKQRQQERFAVAARSKIVAFKKDLLEDPDA